MPQVLALCRSSCLPVIRSSKLQAFGDALIFRRLHYLNLSKMTFRSVIAARRYALLSIRFMIRAVLPS